MANYINFFAYDTLMNPQIFKERGLEANAKFSVTLSAYKLLFNKLPQNGDIKKGVGLPNIALTESNLGMMEGILYEMDEKFLPRLDEIYQHPNQYQRKQMRFTKHDFTFVNGYAYIAPKDQTDDSLLPNQEQLKVFKTCKKSLSMLYFSRLMTRETIEKAEKRGK